MRRRRLSDLDPYLSPPWREQFTRADEERQLAEERRAEQEDGWLQELEPDPEETHDPEDA